MMLAMMSGDMPVALGVIRDVDAPTYDEDRTPTDRRSPGQESDP